MRVQTVVEEAGAHHQHRPGCCSETCPTVCTERLLWRTNEEFVVYMFKALASTPSPVGAHRAGDRGAAARTAPLRERGRPHAQEEPQRSALAPYTERCCGVTCLSLASTRSFFLLRSSRAGVVASHHAGSSRCGRRSAPRLGIS
jgi:hypothetical protein